MNARVTLSIAFLVLMFCSGVVAQSTDEDRDPRFAALDWREVGPYRGGRCAAVAGVAGQRNLYYMGSAGGGVWKTADGGVSWSNISDGFFGGSIGAVAVAPSDPNVIYVGGGEKTIRGNVSHGDGVWRSTDAGRTWQHRGLDDSRHICRLRVDPNDPDHVYAAVLGHLYGSNEERGVFESRNGGESWSRILFVDADSGAVDLAMDPTNARILYASLWQVHRTPWTLESGGPGSSLWKSVDGGATWLKLHENEGFPSGPLGIMGVTVSASNPDNVYAIVEAAEGGVFRSRDAGKTWARTNDERSLRQRAWYYSRIYADPVDEESVYVLNVGFHRSKDGGRKFSRLSTPHSDNHDLWIDPKDPRRMIESNDGGANVTYDAGKTWSRQDNQPTAQMYRVSIDNDFPYRLLGGQQDNSAVRIRSRSLSSGAISLRDWESTAGGESGHIVAKPDDPDIVYGGSYGGYLVRLNHRTGERRSVNVWPDNPMGWGAKDLKYRFQWNFPIFFSPHDPNSVYVAANVLFRTRDGGESWTALSPDLTRNDPARLGPSGGPITKDNTSVEYYCTIFAALESPHEQGVLWCGSDDGLLHVSRDDGEHWNNVTPPELEPWAQINSIEAHPFEPGGLYVAATSYKSDDFRPSLHVTTDYGRTWRKIITGIASDHFTRVVRADPVRRGLLYAGTERGVYVSFDDGAKWEPLQLDLPIVPITDLAVKNGDLIAATQGRGYWILDDLTVLHEWRAELTSTELTSKLAHLYPPRSGYRIGGGRSRQPRNMGANPPGGAQFFYHLKEDLADDVTLKITVMDTNDTVIRTLTRKPDKKKSASEGEAAGRTPDPSRRDRVLESRAGLQRASWDLRYPGAEAFPGMVLWSGGTSGPRAKPGRYRIRLDVGDWSDVQEFELLPDPRSSATEDDYVAQFDFLVQVRDKLTQTHGSIKELRTVRRSLNDLKSKAKDAAGSEPLVALIGSTDEAMTAIEEALYQTKNRSRQDPLNYPIRLSDKLAGVMSNASSGDFRPTRQAYAVREELTAKIDVQLVSLERVFSESLPEINRLAAELGIPAVELPRASAGPGERREIF